VRVRARIVRSQPWRSFVTAVALTYASGALFAALPWFDEWLRGYAWDNRLTYALEHAIDTDAMIVVLVGFLLAAIVPWLVMFWRPRARDVEALPGRDVRLGATTFRRSEVTGLSVAPDGRGVSVAIGRGHRTTFVEVDRMEDAKRFAGALGKRFPIDGALRHRLPRGSFVVVQALFTGIDVLYALLLFAIVASSGWIDATFSYDVMPAFLAGGGALTALTILLVVLRVRRPIALSWDASRATEPARKLDASPLERHVARHLASRLTADPDAPRVRIDLLERRGEPTEVWLTRVDGLKKADAYRGDAFPKDVLWDLVGDEKLGVDARVAAGRLLAVRDREARDGIEAAVHDQEVRARIAAVLDDVPAEEAAEKLDAVGPLFRVER
jgi:hypothetical protein